MICYHGTNKENAGKILKTGFKLWSYFADHLENALEFGGEHIFEVCFDEEGFSTGNGWQFMNRKIIFPDKIVCYKVFSSKIKLENKKLRKQVFESNTN